MGRVFLFDIQGWITLLLGGLLALITLFSSYSHVHIPFLGAVALDQQIGVLWGCPGFVDRSIGVTP